MKAIKLLVVFGVGLAIGLAGGGVFGFSYGKKSAQADIDFQNTGHATVVNLDDVKSAPAPAPAPAPAAPAAAPAAPAAAPAAPAAPADEWAEVGVKTMSQQQVIDLPSDEPAAPAAPAAAPAPAPAAPAAPAGDATTYKISMDDSILNFTGYKTLAGEKVGMNGFFGEFDGTVTVPGGDLSQMSFTVNVKTASISTENAILTGVLKSAAFFDSAAFPTAKIESRKIEKRGEQYVATVAWTMRDKTIGVELPMTITQSGNSITAKCEQFIDRNQWGVGYAEYEGIPILGEVKVSFEMIASK